MKDEVRIGNIYLDYKREAALAALQKAKELEKQQMEQGRKYIRVDDKTLKLVKI